LPVTVSGTITNRSGAAIPASARALVLWFGDDGSGDYAYVFGEGSIDGATNRFTITLDQNPPRAAVPSARLGVAFVILTTDQGLQPGRIPEGSGYLSSVIGVTAQHAVIYLEDDPGSFGSAWPARFRPGYNVGIGVKVPGATFDDFAPAGLNSMELIVDDLENIETVNWS